MIDQISCPPNDPESPKRCIPDQVRHTELNREIYLRSFAKVCSLYVVYTKTIVNVRKSIARSYMARSA